MNSTKNNNDHTGTSNQQAEPLKELDRGFEPYTMQADHWKQQAEQSILGKVDTRSEGKETVNEATITHEASCRYKPGLTYFDGFRDAIKWIKERKNEQV